MEFKLRFPGCVEFEYKREPLSYERFMAICVLIGIYIVGSGILKFFQMSVK